MKNLLTVVCAGAGLVTLPLIALAEGTSPGSPNLQAIRAIHESGQNIITAFRNADIAAADMEWWVAGPQEILPFSGSYRGLDGVSQFQDRLREAVRYDTVQIVEYIDGGDQVAVIFLGEGIARASGRPFASTILRLFTFDGGKVVRVRNFLDTAAYVAAVQGPATGDAPTR